MSFEGDTRDRERWLSKEAGRFDDAVFPRWVWFLVIVTGILLFCSSM